jgi:hypothetical protein
MGELSVSVKGGLLDAAPFAEPQAILVGRVLLSRGFAARNAADLSRIMRLAADSFRAAAQPLLLWVVVDPEAEVPSRDAQHAMQRAVVSLLNYCQSVTLVVGGTGVRETLVRTTLRGMTTLGGNALRVRVAEDFAAAARAAGDPELDVAELEQAARAAGVL